MPIVVGELLECLTLVWVGQFLISERINGNDLLPSAAAEQTAVPKC